MGETALTKKLKMACILFLKNNGCDEIAPEVKIYPARHLFGNDNPLDKHNIIDICGVGVKYRQNPDPYGSMIKEPIIRGIEIKISRGDFRNGFIHSGCNYNYLLFPKGLVKKEEVRPEIGLIEYEPETFSVKKVMMKYWFTGFKVIRAPRFKEISERDFGYVRGQIAYCASLQLIQWAREQLA